VEIPARTLFFYSWRRSPMSIKEVVKKLRGTKLRKCACGKSFKYSGRGRPFKFCPKCR
jgi:rRNA maturation endonuclease Nob1